MPAVNGTTWLFRRIHREGSQEAAGLAIPGCITLADPVSCCDITNTIQGAVRIAFTSEKSKSAIRRLKIIIIIIAAADITAAATDSDSVVDAERRKKSNRNQFDDE